MERTQFEEYLVNIIDMAHAKNNYLTLDEVDNHFKELSLTKEQLSSVYIYLESNDITIEGHEKNDMDGNVIAEDMSKLDSDAQSYLEMYLADIESISNNINIDEAQLISGVINKDEGAISTFIESKLLYVVDIAKGYVNRGVIISDLIQEGNLGLIDSVNNYEQQEISLNEWITNGIRQAIENAIDEQYEDTSAAKIMANKANELDDAARELAVVLGREANETELAEHMNISVDEVKNIMKISLDAISVEKPSQ